MLIGYARVSTTTQNLDRQLGALRAAGCERIFAEKASGKSAVNRPELEKAIDALGTGWTLVVAEWDRATRSMLDGIQIIERVAARGAMIRVLDKPFLDLTSTMGKGILAFLSALAQDERERIVRRARSGLDEARRRGVKFGRRSALDAHRQKIALERLSRGDTTREIAKDMQVGHSTISRLNRKASAAQDN